MNRSSIYYVSTSSFSRNVQNIYTATDNGAYTIINCCLGRRYIDHESQHPISRPAMLLFRMILAIARYFIAGLGPEHCNSFRATVPRSRKMIIFLRFGLTHDLIQYCPSSNDFTVCRIFHMKTVTITIDKSRVITQFKQIGSFFVTVLSQRCVSVCI